MTKTEYAQVAAELNALWPASRWEVGTLRAGEALLLDLDARTALAAVRAMACEGERFAPNPGQLRARALALSGPAIPTADQALSEVYRQIAAVGHTGNPQWSHPAIADAVAAMGGWLVLCASEEPMADRAHFLRLYVAVERRHSTAAVLAPSVGELLASLDLSAARALTP